jgi:hypothetical protein
VIWLMVFHVTAFHVTAFHVTSTPFSEVACRRGVCQRRTCRKCGFDGANEQIPEINGEFASLGDATTITSNRQGTSMPIPIWSWYLDDKNSHSGISTRVIKFATCHWYVQRF